MEQQLLSPVPVCLNAVIRHVVTPGHLAVCWSWRRHNVVFNFLVALKVVFYDFLTPEELDIKDAVKQASDILNVFNKHVKLGKDNINIHMYK